ncbi:Alpha/Beta hydrolase protein [Xylariomycetidae sp. FL0641]|nr:Alpha/Beta hydrolase protein [Xylariomycetidae sp. FL0641]
MMWCKFLSLAILAVAGARGIPSPKSLNSDVTLLIDNDLRGPESPSANSGVLLLGPRPLAEAVKSCKDLGEQLWSPELKTASILPSLDYLNYTKKTGAGSRFWIAPGNFSASARALDTDGHISPVNASLQLPALCSQSAPFSNETFADTSKQWRVTVRSNNEYISGFRDRLSFRFLGLRYAPKPKRFTYSVPYVGNGSQVVATDFGSQCAQAGGVGTEDCLFLNVWTPYLPGPRSRKGDLKPVMFWIHGGAFTGGTSSDPTFDGGNLASRNDVVVVAINYRISTLGFLALNDGTTNGNFGLADQVNALDWVQRNIKDFGGDPDRVTILGQSAGAASVRALMESPKAVGKFSGAIPVSNLGGINYGTTYSKYLTIGGEMETAGNDLLATTNCTNATSQVECLRAVPASTLVDYWNAPRYLVVDGVYLTTDELQLDGPPSPIHLMMGSLRDDGAPFISYPTTANESSYLSSQGFDVPSAEVFPIPDLQNQTLALFNMSTRLATDGIFRCIDQATVHAGLKNGQYDQVYYYEFNRTYQTTGWPGLDVCEPPLTDAHPFGDPNQEYFKCHSGELYYVFGTLGRQGLPMRDEFDLPFEQYVQDSFASFARTYDPNPDPEYLKARGYRSTMEEIERSGPWKPATREESITRRTLQWPTGQVPFEELEQCKALGLGLDYYLQ